MKLKPGRRAGTAPLMSREHFLLRMLSEIEWLDEVDCLKFLFGASDSAAWRWSRRKLLERELIRIVPSSAQGRTVEMIGKGELYDGDRTKRGGPPKDLAHHLMVTQLYFALLCPGGGRIPEAKRGEGFKWWDARGWSWSQAPADTIMQLPGAEPQDGKPRQSQRVQSDATVSLEKARRRFFIEVETGSNVLTRRHYFRTTVAGKLDKYTRAIGALGGGMSLYRQRFKDEFSPYVMFISSERRAAQIAEVINNHMTGTRQPFKFLFSSHTMKTGAAAILGQKTEEAVALPDAKAEVLARFVEFVQADTKSRVTHWEQQGSQGPRPAYSPEWREVLTAWRDIKEGLRNRAGPPG